MKVIKVKAKIADQDERKYATTTINHDDPIPPPTAISSGVSITADRDKSNEITMLAESIRMLMTFQRSTEFISESTLKRYFSLVNDMMRYIDSRYQYRTETILNQYMMRDTRLYDDFVRLPKNIQLQIIVFISEILLTGFRTSGFALLQCERYSPEYYRYYKIFGCDVIYCSDGKLKIKPDLTIDLTTKLAQRMLEHASCNRTLLPIQYLSILHTMKEQASIDPMVDVLSLLPYQDFFTRWLDTL